MNDQPPLPSLQATQGDSTRYSALLQVAEAIARHADLSALIRDLAWQLPRVIPVNFVALSLYDEAHHAMRLHSLYANVPADIIGGHLYPVDDTPAGFVWETQQPLFISDVARDSRWQDVLARMGEDGIRSICFVPLSTTRQRLGALAIASCDAITYGPQDVEALQQLGYIVAMAVENVLSREAAEVSRRETERERDRLGLLLRMTKAMGGTLDPREVFKAVSVGLRQTVSHDYASLALYDQTTDQVMLHALDFPGNPGDFEEGMTAPVAGSTMGTAVREQRPVVVGDQVSLAAYDHPISRRMIAVGFQSVCSLPLMSRGRVMGCLNVVSRREQAFGDTDVAYLNQIAGQIALAVDNALAYQEIAALKDKVTEEKLYLEEEIRSEQRFDDIIGDSRALKQVLSQVEIVAPTQATVLILGETGTGKELIARAIHRLSDRNQRTFVKLNCAAIPTGLLESELFGHERGAFTGAIAQKVGRFELAHGGTIFLDEVGEIPLELQSKLLRVLQEQEFERLGSTRTVHVDIRLIAATNRDLAKLVENHEFRSDLYYRLNVFPITPPPLRERREDIPVLVRYFTQHYAARMKKPIESIPAATLEALSRYHWPGNIRELENLIERAVILTQGTHLQVPLPELKIHAQQPPVPGATLHDAEREQILRTLRETRWVIGGPDGAAARLGLKRTTLTSKIKKLGIDRPRG
ncbi:MAG: sigma 54-interacting transcriptional regulator [Nitrospira sp.]|nr:sigma 54-interacting transcriptional regulator [Nitrospira sp.]